MRILIVEDEPLVRQRLLRLCSELAGVRARFDAVADLESAGDRLQRSVYDGLLLDLNLGGDDGFELLRRAVAGRYQCVVVSAHRDRALQAFEHGVLDFVPKPSRVSALARHWNACSTPAVPALAARVIWVSGGHRARRP